MHRGLSTEAGAKLLQPAEEAPLIESGMRQNVSLLTVKHRSSGSAEQWGLLNLSKVRVDTSRDPEILAISCRVLLPLALLAAHVDEAALLSSEYSTACSNVIARPSARAASKASSPIWERTAATVLSYGER